MVGLTPTGESTSPGSKASMQSGWLHCIIEYKTLLHNCDHGLASKNWAQVNDKQIVPSHFYPHSKGQGKKCLSSNACSAPNRPPNCQNWLYIINFESISIISSKKLHGKRMMKNRQWPLIYHGIKKGTWFAFFDRDKPIPSEIVSKMY